LRRVTSFTVAVAIAASSVPPPRAATPERGEQLADVHNHADVDSAAAAASTGQVLQTGAVTTGDAVSRVRPDQRAENLQRSRACRDGACLQRTAIVNVAALRSRADSENTGTARPGGTIVTGDALSQLEVGQEAVNRQVAGACARCTQDAGLRNVADVVSDADASNARDTAPGARLATPRATSRIELQQHAEVRQAANRCECLESVTVVNAARVRSFATGRLPVPSAPLVRRLPGSPSPANTAVFLLAGRENHVALQQDGHVVEQAAAYNVVRVAVRQTLVFRGRELVEHHETVRTSGWTRDVLPSSLEPAGHVPSVSTCLSRRGDQPRRRTPACTGPSGNAVRVEQRARENVAAIQQAAVQVRQTGVVNVALVELDQRIVLTSESGCAGPTAGDAIVQQSAQSVAQTGAANRARVVVRRTVDCGR
jgi:hypothetical protein